MPVQICADADPDFDAVVIGVPTGIWLDIPDKSTTVGSRISLQTREETGENGSFLCGGARIGGFGMGAGWHEGNHGHA